MVWLATVGALVVGGALYGAYRGFVMRQPSVTPTPEPSVERSIPSTTVTLRPFEFQTVTVDERGVKRERRQLLGQSFTEDLGNGVTLEMVAIGGGTFTMGSPANETGSDAERPQHSVTVAPFYIGKFEVTQGQWRAIAALTRVARDLVPHPSGFKGANRPVEQVTWHDAAEFCARLSRKTSRTYRLPSEAEWEYAARASTTTPFAFGATITPVLVNYDDRTPLEGESRRQAIDVGSLGYANPFGLFDLHGNVWEWTQDVWHDSYKGAPADGRAWETGGDQARRVLRGGSWFSDAMNCRSALRNRNGPENRLSDVGFRVVCAISRTP